MAAARTQKPKKFSEAELQKLEEPLFVRIEREVSGRRTPMDVPPGPEETISGKGYTQDMVRQIKHLTKEWGPGLYHIEITDKQGVSLVDECFWNAESLAAQGYSTTVVQPAAASQPAAPAMGFAGPSNGAAPAPTVSPNYLQTFFPSAAPAQANPHRPIGWAPPTWPAPAPTPTKDSKDREEVLTMRAQIERERQEAQHQRAMDSMNQEMRRIQEQIAKRPEAEESSALKQAQREIEQLKQQNSTQAITSQMSSMQQNFQQGLQQMQQSFQQMMERQASETEKRLAAIENNKDDGSLQVILQSMQQQAQSQNQQMQMFMTMMQQQQQQQMRPGEIMDIFRQANAGHDQMASAYGKAWELMANGVEQLISAQGPGIHPAVAMIGQAAEGGLGMVQRYLEMKETESTANAQARQAAAHYEAQTKIQTEAIRANSAKGIAPQLGAQEGEGADGSEGAEGSDSPEEPTEASEEMRDAERQILGNAWHPVQNLRRGVADGKVSEQQCAAAIFQAIEHFAAQEQLPPVFELWKEERFPEFIEVLLPHAHHEFREKVTQIIYGAIVGMKKQQASANAQVTEQKSASG